MKSVPTIRPHLGQLHGTVRYAATWNVLWVSVTGLEHPSVPLELPWSPCGLLNQQMEGPGPNSPIHSFNIFYSTSDKGLVP